MRFLGINLALMLPLLVSTAASQESDTALRFAATEGRIRNEFFRDGPAAAHLVLTSGTTPRLVVAFPAGNSGVAAWFDSPGKALTWSQAANIEAAKREQDDGTLHGITAELSLGGDSVLIKHVIASSVRVIRDYGYTGETRPEVLVAPQLTSRSATWQRRRLDGAPGYYLSIEVLNGAVTGGAGKPVSLVAGDGNDLRLRVTALTGEKPLVALPMDRLLNGLETTDSALRQKLAFLSYQDKLLAGSWRFNTYFGRDTLMSIELLMPVLQAEPIEAGLGSVLQRLNRGGEVAHEEDIGEYAVLRHLKEDGQASDAPIFDYKMIDDDFLLPIVASHYLLDTSAGRERAAAFLARHTTSGESFGAALVRNFAFVHSAASAFAHDPQWRNLVALKPGATVGDWRDSQEGLGGGRYPYDVNGVFVPAALTAIARFSDAGVLEDYLDEQTAIALSSTRGMADVWRRRAPAYFEVAVPPERARRSVAGYAERVGVEASPALASLDSEPVRFHGLALDASGVPLPILHSDEGFALLFLDITAQETSRVIGTLLRPFPAGLATDVGVVVANPAYAGEKLQPLFSRARYHGTVIWSWQHAMIAAGLARQLGRDDLAEADRDVLQRGLAKLESAMAASRDIRGSELWSWSQSNGRYRVEPFGQRTGDETESNAAQLWSTVHLAPFFKARSATH